MVEADSRGQLTTQSPFERWGGDCALDLDRAVLRGAFLDAKEPLSLMDPAAAGPLPKIVVAKSEGRSFATSAFATRRENWGYDLFTRFDNRVGLYSSAVQQKQQIGFVFLIAKRLL
jgi:hypothetical protein